MWVDRADLSIAGNGKRYGAPTGLHVPVPAIQYRLRLALRTRQVNCRGASLLLPAEKRAKKGLITMIWARARLSPTVLGTYLACSVLIARYEHVS